MAKVKLGKEKTETKTEETIEEFAGQDRDDKLNAATNNNPEDELDKDTDDFEDEDDTIEDEDLAGDSDTIEEDEDDAIEEDEDDTIEDEDLAGDSDTIEEDEDDAIEDEKPKVKSRRGVVSGCNLLAIRDKPSVAAKTIWVVCTNTEVRVDHENSTEDFYKVEVKGGPTGFCMKSFIKI